MWVLKSKVRTWLGLFGSGTIFVPYTAGARSSIEKLSVLFSHNWLIKCAYLWMCFSITQKWGRSCSLLTNSVFSSSLPSRTGALKSCYHLVPSLPGHRRRDESLMFTPTANLLLNTVLHHWVKWINAKSCWKNLQHTEVRRIIVCFLIIIFVMIFTSF